MVRASASASSRELISPAKVASRSASSSSPTRGPGSRPSSAISSSPRTGGAGAPPASRHAIAARAISRASSRWLSTASSRVRSPRVARRSAPESTVTSTSTGARAPARPEPALGIRLDLEHAPEHLERVAPDVEVVIRVLLDALERVELRQPLVREPRLVHQLEADERPAGGQQPAQLVEAPLRRHLTDV